MILTSYYPAIDANMCQTYRRSQQYSGYYFCRRRSTPRFNSRQLLGIFGQIDLGSKAKDLSLILVHCTCQTFVYCKRAYLIFVLNVLCSAQARFLILQARPWRHKRHFEAILFRIPANKGVFERPGPPASDAQSGVGPADHLGHRNAQFLSSINWCCQPRCCPGSEQNKLNILLSITYQVVVCQSDALLRGIP